MPSSSGVTVQIDPEAGAAYITLGAGTVARTVKFDEDIYVDLDEFGMVLGIELLDLDRAMPLDELAERFHINTSTLAGLVRSIRWGGTPRAAHSSSSRARPATFGTVAANDTTLSSC